MVRKKCVNHKLKFNTRRKTEYTSEFKEEAVKIGLSSDEPYFVTAADLGIGKKTFYNWINKSMSEKMHLPKSTKQNGLKYQELERECNKAQKCSDGAGHTKKSRGVFCKQRPVRCAFIKSNAAHYAVRLMCDILGVARSRYYHWSVEPQSKRQK